ncbi:MAG TPA: cysteine dioxygenase family protein [Mycobacteriales bacterium]|jgi:predicted metal-dependent enzyme (double-stranded beta helix superfamily)|nr:cysteine dioxygenase family protein [Mycobacteriales bacterium]
MHLEPYLLLPSALTATALSRLAADLAADPRLWRDRLRWTEDERWHAHLRSTPLYDVWLLSWTPGQATELHDHGGSSGAFSVLTGTLRETLAAATPTGVRQSERTIGAGRTVAFGPEHVHDVGHAGHGPAASLHVYSPPLRSMTYYETAGGELRRQRATATTVPEPTWPSRASR